LQLIHWLQLSMRISATKGITGDRSWSLIADR
jgi:hypothetical protein